VDVNVKPLIPFVLTALLWGLIYLGFEIKLNHVSLVGFFWEIGG
jgi:hypothetical protein